MSGAQGPFHMAATGLAAFGLPVLPLRTLAKSPAVRNWQRVATADPERAGLLVRRHGGCNIGIAAGAGLVVLDIDTKHGKDGYASLRALEAEHGPLPATVAAQTPTGGAHLYFRVPVSVHVPGSVDRLGPGLDVRGAT